MSYKKKGLKKRTGGGPPQEWKPAAHGEGHHTFVEPTPVGLGARTKKGNPPASPTELTPPQPPAEKKPKRPPTTTQPVAEGLKRDVDPTEIVGGVIGRLILGNPFRSTQFKLDKRAQNAGVIFRPRDQYIIHYATADGMMNGQNRVVVLQPGFLARALQESYAQGLVDPAQTGEQRDLDLTNTEGRIQLRSARPSSEIRTHVEADLSQVVQELAEERAMVRQGLGLRDQTFYPQVKIGTLELGERVIPEDSVGMTHDAIVAEVGTKINIGQLSLGPLAVFPRDQ